MFYAPYFEDYGQDDINIQTGTCNLIQDTPLHCSFEMLFAFKAVKPNSHVLVRAWKARMSN